MNLIGIVTTLKTHPSNPPELQQYKNTIVNVGLAFICERLLDNNKTPMSHMAVGGSNVSTQMIMSTLTAEINRRPFQTSSASGNKLQYTTAWPAGVLTGKTVKEIGLFNAATNGTMLSRVICCNETFTALNGFNVVWEILVENK